jgi:hypothetical protein
MSQQNSTKSTTEQAETVEVQETEAVITEAVTSVSPYKASVIVNEALKVAGILNEDGSQKVLPAQMFYNYTRTDRKNKKGAVQKPLIPTIVTQAGRREITLVTLTAWLDKYITKQQAPKATEATDTVVESTEPVSLVHAGRESVEA